MPASKSAHELPCSKGVGWTWLEIEFRSALRSSSSYGPFIMGDSHSFVASFKIRVVVVLEGCRVSRVPEPNSGGQEHCGLASSARFHLSSGVLFASSSPTCHSALKVSAPMIRDPSRPEAGVRVLSTWQDPRSAAGPRKRLKSPFPFSIYVFPLECVSHVSVVPFWPYLFYHPYHPLFLLL